MREESEKFRKWKADNERAMLRLRNEDRKRATAMAKMESLHAKQQNVLKRKMEEAVAVNKRLKVRGQRDIVHFHWSPWKLNKVTSRQCENLRQ